MKNEEILANSPDGATHYDGGVWVQSTGKQPLEKYGEAAWDYEQGYEMEDIRSLSDIRRIVELEKYNLGLATESHELQQKLEAAERERDELIVFSQHLIDCHKNGIQCLVDIDYSEFAGKFAIEQQIKAVEYCYKNIPDLADSDYVKLKRRAEQLRQQLNWGS